jgi:hypothetical protein
MAKSLRDAVFAVDDPTVSWSARDSLAASFWPPLGSPFSLVEFTQRYASAGAALRTLASGGTDAWDRIDRSSVVPQLRDRLRDPGIMRQEQTDLCGPYSVVFELARRRRVRYVKFADELLTNGELHTSEGTIEAEEDLRERSVPEKIADVDWLYTSTIRDDENLTEDVDDGEGIEGLTLWGAMADWTRGLLGLNSHWETCINSGELDALVTAQDAIDAGGVAFMLIDANLIKNGGDDSEEDMHWRSRRHAARKPLGKLSDMKHSEDDAFPPDHWVVYLGGLTPRHPGEDDQITLKLWSWGREFTISGNCDSFGEYLYAVVTGKP